MTARTVIVISDLHCGCRLGLCPPSGAALDGGGTYEPSRFQRKVWQRWTAFWDEWVPHVTKGEPFALVVNGDALDGIPHGAKTPISHNLSDQEEIGYRVLLPIVDMAEAYYHVRGTEAHVGKSGEEEERLAQRLGAEQDATGAHSRWDLWMNLQNHLLHFEHHIGTTASSAYESTAVGKEMVEGYVEAGRWGRPPAQVTVRSHRHRYYKTEQYGEKGLHISLVTPAWQGKTPFAHRVARFSEPQIGGIAIRAGEDEPIYTRAMVWAMERSPVEVVSGPAQT